MAVPTVSTVAPSNITSTTAQLNGLVNPNGLDTNAIFECSPTYPIPPVVNSDTPNWDSGSGTSQIAYSYVITGLSPSTLYYFDAYCGNSSGTARGAVLSFTTQAATYQTAPTVNTDQATPTATSAVLMGDLSPNGLTSFGFFQYGLTSRFGSSTPLTPSLGSGLTDLYFNETISGLQSNTLYYYRACGQNSAGTTYGPESYFTTAAAPTASPTVTTGTATSITTTTVVLQGTLNPNGLDTQGFFNWGTTTAYGTATANQDQGLGTTAVPFTQSITGLTAGTTYYYEAGGTNSAGSTYGSGGSFTTLSVPLVPYAPINLSPSSGSVNLALPTTLSWSAFSSPIAGDTQVGFSGQWSSNGGSTWHAFTGTTGNSAVIGANAFPADPIQWEVKVTGSSGYTSSYSTLAYITAAAAPATPTITAPTSGAVISSNPGTVTWTDGGHTDYEVRTVADVAGSPNTMSVYYDSGDVPNSSATQSASIPFQINEIPEHIEVRVENSGLWSLYADVLVNVNYPVPDAPITTLMASAATASITVAITND